MNQIYAYLDNYNVPKELSGYDHLANVISYACKNGLGVANAVETEANKSGLSVEQMRGRLRYAVSLSRADNTKVTKFIRLAVRAVSSSEVHS